MRTARRLEAGLFAGGTLALLVAGCAVWNAPSTTACSRAAAAHGFRLRFDESGALVASCAAEVQKIHAAAGNATDIFIFSHGWWNDPESAEETYARFIEGMQAVRPSLAGRQFRPLLVGIYWPSAHFPLGPGSGEESSAASTELLRSHINRVFGRVARAEGVERDIAVVGALMDKERAGQPLTREEFTALAGILKRWDTLARPATPEEAATDDSEAPGEEDIFRLSVGELAQHLWRTSHAAGEIGLETGRPSVLAVLNVFTFWQMKRRAGIVGETGVHSVLQTLRARLEEAGNGGARLYLVGHSFGGKLLSAALLGAPNREPNRASYLILIQGAFSHFVFAGHDALANLGIESRGRREGRYAEVVRRRLVERRIIVTRSDRDIPNRFLYPLGVRLSGDALERGGPPTYGALGTNGALRTNASDVLLPRGARGWKVAQFREPIINLDASQVISGHGAYFEREIYALVWELVTDTP